MAKRKEDTREKCSKQLAELKATIEAFAKQTARKTNNPSGAARQLPLHKGAMSAARNENNQPYFSQQPCWDCRKFAGGCSWSERFEPVEGWQARRVKKKYCGKVCYETYEIRYCPEFEHD